MRDFPDPNPVGNDTGLQFLQNANTKRRFIRMQKNPMDKCTIVSIFPKEIIETKPTIEPGKFVIPYGSLEDPGLLIVGSSSWWNDYDIEKPVIEVPVSSIQVADSVVKDYCNGMLGCNMADAMPGLFFVMGARTQKEILTEWKKALDEANKKQMKWYEILVLIADVLWSRTNGNPLTISDEARLAANSLNLKDKPWLKDIQMIEQVRCKACGSLKQPSYPVCPVCKAIDQDNPLAKDLKFAV